VRASRLLSIQMLLQSRGRMSAATLAGMLEVSVRTLYRDVDQLSQAGVPIYAERGRAGGFALMAGWNTSLTGMTSAEATAIALIGLGEPAAQLGLSQAAMNAELKLRAALPIHQRQHAERTRSRFHVDVIDWYQTREVVPYLTITAKAVWHEQLLAIRYQSWKGVVRRVVRPLGLVLKAGIWYCIAAPHSSKEQAKQGPAKKTARTTPRTYRLSNVIEAKLLPQRFQRPTSFDLPGFWQESLARFSASLFTQLATIQASAEGLAKLRASNTLVAQAIDQQRSVLDVERLGDTAMVTLKIPIESIATAATQLLALAPHVIALAPPELRSSIKEKISDLQRSYRRH
jgi:predicted DNA-binding transcriptional regulator YafY